MDNDIAGATLVDVPWLFEDRKCRRLLLNNCRNDYVKSFWKGQAERAGGGTDLISSLLGNVGTLLLFRLGVLDADRLADFTRPEIGEKDLQDLPNYHVAARLLVDGRPSRGFVFQTDPPVQGAASSFDALKRRERIEQVQRCYARPVAEVEAEIIARRARLAEN